MLTADNITDDQIRELDRSAGHERLGAQPGSGTIHDLCILALGCQCAGCHGRSWRARCAEILNARTKEQR